MAGLSPPFLLRIGIGETMIALFCLWARKTFPTHDNMSRRISQLLFLCLVLLGCSVEICSAKEEYEVKASNVEEIGVAMASPEGKTSWPELVGMNGQEAKSQLEASVSDKQIFVVPEDGMVTMDYRTDRIRIFVDKDGNVARPPTLG